MYQQRYIESIDESSQECRDRERRALSHAIQLLGEAQQAGRTSQEAANALQFVCALWRTLISDLVCPENDLPDVLRGDLVSVGIWILREADSIRRGDSGNFGGIIEICSTIRDGLK